MFRTPTAHPSRESRSYFWGPWMIQMGDAQPREDELQRGPAAPHIPWTQPRVGMATKQCVCVCGVSTYAKYMPNIMSHLTSHLSIYGFPSV